MAKIKILCFRVLVMSKMIIISKLSTYFWENYDVKLNVHILNIQQ